MNAPWPLLSLLTFLPLLGVALIGLLSWTEEEKRVPLARWIALATSGWSLDKLLESPRFIFAARFKAVEYSAESCILRWLTLGETAE